MVETPKSNEESLYQHVEFHSLGRKEHGTVKLTRDHLIFSFSPSASSTDKSARNGSAVGTPTRHQPLLSAESSTLSEASTVSSKVSLSNEKPTARQLTGHDTANHETAAKVDGKAADGKEARVKQRPKELWVPYPMINYCVLRPSHAPAQAVRPQAGDVYENGHHENDELFPPTFGTATFERPSSDSTRAGPNASSPRPVSPVPHDNDTATSMESGRPPAIRIRLKDFKTMALHFHGSHSGTSRDETARQAFFSIRNRCCVDDIDDFLAFHFHQPKEEAAVSVPEYDARREYARMGIGGKAAQGPGSAWRITDINRDYSYSVTYPSVLCVPRTVSDNMLKYGGAFRSRSRIPCLSYLHFNGGSITRASQPMVGVQNKRNPQDERLVSAIFSSHTAPLQHLEDSSLQKLPSASETISEAKVSDGSTLDSGVPGLPTSHSDTALDESLDESQSSVRQKVYGSTRRNLIADARPRINALANRATGGGIEDVANYKGNNGIPIEKVFLNIANIHVMRASLEKVMESFANSDYIKMKPDQEALRKSGWLGHIAGLLDGTEMIARVVGLGGSHVLIHCSDGWDRTAQVSALAQVMLDPHARTLNGFITLVQKEFLSFGHKFRDRNGIEGSEKWFEIENERVAPSRIRESSADSTSLNNIGAKALSGAKNWFEKNRNSFFKQQNTSRDNLGDQSNSRPPSPPPNALLHSPPSSTGKEEKGHKMSEKEVAPIFHQFLDGVYQLLDQNPDAFEFNERFLRRLFYHTYSCQYGEFLFNTEKERSQYKRKAPSVWSHFFSRRQEFTNPNYTAKEDDPLLFPKRSGVDREVEVRWWHALFGRADDEMNLPRALERPDISSATANPGPTISLDEQASNADAAGDIKVTQSTPNLTSMKSSLPSSFSSLTMESNVSQTEARVDATAPMQSLDIETDTKKTPQAHQLSESKDDRDAAAEEYDGDPLGVTATPTKTAVNSGLDFAAFASQNAFTYR